MGKKKIVFRPKHFRFDRSGRLVITKKKYRKILKRLIEGRAAVEVDPDDGNIMKPCGIEPPIGIEPVPYPLALCVCRGEISIRIDEAGAVNIHTLGFEDDDDDLIVVEEDLENLDDQG